MPPVRVRSTFPFHHRLSIYPRLPRASAPRSPQDTEFPGIVARPIGSFKTGSDYHYQTMRCNVDMLKIIQLGVTLSDETGKSPEGYTWQFNFQFNLT
jgi:CCR4-NOT transcription complex subunit 7/8